MKICPQCQTQYEDEQPGCTECGCGLLTEHGPDEAYPWTCVIERLDERLTIPMAAGTKSLNVLSAATLMLYRAAHSRKLI